MHLENERGANGLHAVHAPGQMTVLTNSKYTTPVKGESILNFFRLLYGDAAPGYITIWTPKDKATHTFSASDLQSAAQTAARLSESDSVYYGVGLQGQPPTEGRGTAAGVIAIPGVWCDLDIGADGHKKAGIPTLDAALDLLAEVDPLPTAVVNTGHGLHVYWLFPQPWVFQDDNERQDAAALVKSFQASIKAKAARHGWNIDSTHDLARLLRPIGTVNRKRDPLPVASLQVIPDQCYTPDELKQFLAPALRIVQPEPAAPASSNGNGHKLTLVEYDDDPREFWLNRALEWVATAAKDGRNMSAFDLACQLRDSGVSQSDAEGVMMAFQSQVETAGDHPYTRAEVLASLEQAYSRAAREPAKSRQTLAVEAARRTIVVAESVTDTDEVADTDTDEGDAPSPLLQDVADLGDLGWLDEYTDIASDLTNAPRSFNRLCGLATAAIAIQHRAVLRMSFDNIRPNIYGAIVAPSTVYHKTTTLRQSQSLLNRAGLGHLRFASQFSSEGLLSCLSERPAGIVYRDEVGTLFASDRVKYLASLKQDLTALYDGADYSRQLARETISVSRPYLNILGATTPTRFYQGVTLADWQDGFLARWLFVLPDCEPDFDSSPSMFTAEHDVKLERLAARLRDIDSYPAHDFSFDPDAFRAWDQWQRQSKKQAYLFGDDIVASIVGRYATYALKFAMILASLNGEFGRISPKSIAQGMALADYYKASVYKLLEGRQNHGISGDKMQKVFAVIAVKGPEARTKVIQQFAHLNASETRAVLDKLVEIGAVVSKSVGRGTAYTATTDKLPIRSW